MRKRYIFVITLLMMLFITSCTSSKEIEKYEQTEIKLEQPIVNLENLTQGVRIKWNEISNAEGYYVYSRTKEDYKKIATITDPTMVEYIDLEAAAGTDYYYAVRAYIGEQRSDYKAKSITTGIWEPKIKVVYEESHVKITWNQISGSDGYSVYRKEDGEDYRKISTINDSATISYIDEEVLSGKIYTYAVRAYIGDEKSTYTSVTCATINEPTVEVENIGEGLKISWNEIEEAEGYYVYRTEEGGKYQVLQIIEDTASTTYIDRDLSYGTKYYYAIRAYLGEQKSSYSPVDIVADLGRVSVSIEAVDSGVQLEWNKIDSAEGYYVYKKEEGDEEYSLVNTITDASIVSYLDQQVESGKTYYYAVRAFLGEEQSRYSGGTVTIANN